jgi:exodeoxyribonuclease V alpha subunit
VTIEDITARLSTQYGFGKADIRQALDKHDGVELVGVRDSAIAIPGIAKCERDLLKVIKKMSASPLRRRSTAHDIDAKFGGLQREAIETILTNRVCAITGGPGTGKTSICAEVATQLKDVLGIALSARAAGNLRDRSNAPTRTIRSFLNLAERCEIQPYRALIIDEASMIGTKNLREILRIAERAGVKRIALIGDSDQLPPIEWGRPFADLIEGKALPTVRLTENKRTDADGGIARLASDMRQGLAPYPSFATYDHVTLTDVCSDDEALYRVQQAYLLLIQGGASFSEIAVLSPYRDPKFALSSERLNRVIRQSLGMAASKASVGEIVIATQNDHDNNAINGVRGIVKTSDENGLTVQFEGTNDTAVYRNDDLSKSGLPEGVAWGYAYSVHKAQGSEFRHVIVVVSEEMARLFGKPALYTAVTRARESLAIIGDLFSLRSIIAAPDRRFTMLGALFGKSAHPIMPEPCPDYDAYFRTIAMDKREVAMAE